MRQLLLMPEGSRGSALKANGADSLKRPSTWEDALWCRGWSIHILMPCGPEIGFQTLKHEVLAPPTKRFWQQAAAFGTPSVRPTTRHAKRWRLSRCRASTRLCDQERRRLR